MLDVKVLATLHSGSLNSRFDCVTISLVYLSSLLYSLPPDSHIPFACLFAFLIYLHFPRHNYLVLPKKYQKPVSVLSRDLHTEVVAVG